MEILLQRENALSLFRNLNKAVLKSYVELKKEYEGNPPPTTEIVNTLKVRFLLLRLGKKCSINQSIMKFCTF